MTSTPDARSAFLTACLLLRCSLRASVSAPALRGGRSVARPRLQGFEHFAAPGQPSRRLARSNGRGRRLCHGPRAWCRGHCRRPLRDLHLVAPWRALSFAGVLARHGTCSRAARSWDQAAADVARQTGNDSPPPAAVAAIHHRAESRNDAAVSRPRSTGTAVSGYFVALSGGWRCSTQASGPGKTRPMCPSSDHSTR